MEPIKITDKITLRQEALKMAITHAEHSDFTEQIIRAAKTYESYLQGSAELPEYSDHEKYYTEILSKMQESFKPKPIWYTIPRDGEGFAAKEFVDGLENITPFFYADKAINRTVLIAEPRDLWDGEADYIMREKGVVAYCPIEVPKYEPTL